MPKYGRNSYPKGHGGGDSIVQQEHEALLDALDPAWDTKDTETELFAETYADALVISMIWTAGKRLRNQAIPEKMLENLVVWEEATGLRPTIDDLDRDRRARLSAKLRGMANNALGDIEDASRKMLGVNFVALQLVDPVNVITYWPGVNPGPPGLEWSSNRARICVHMSTTNLGTQAYIDKRNSLVVHLDSMLPAWMSFVVGTGTSFVCDIGIVGQTLL